MRISTPPDSSRNVRGFLVDGREVICFYWRADRNWYLANGSKRKSRAIHVVDWREIEQPDRKETE